MTVSDLEFTFASSVPENFRQESRDSSHCQSLLLSDIKDQRDPTANNINNIDSSYNVNHSIKEDFNFDDEYHQTYEALCNEFSDKEFCPSEVGWHRKLWLSGCYNRVCEICKFKKETPSDIKERIYLQNCQRGETCYYCQVLPPVPDSIKFLSGEVRTDEYFQALRVPHTVFCQSRL